MPEILVARSSTFRLNFFIKLGLYKLTIIVFYLQIETSPCLFFCIGDSGATVDNNNIIILYYETCRSCSISLTTRRKYFKADTGFQPQWILMMKISWKTYYQGLAKTPFRNSWTGAVRRCALTSTRVCCKFVGILLPG